MKQVELHVLDYGECVVLRGEAGILMVDCGGEARRFSPEGEAREVSVRPSLLERYRKEKERRFLLTHYHLDRVSALRSILKTRKDCFQKLYAPSMPCDRYGRPLLLEYSLFLQLFQEEQDPSGGTILQLFSEEEGFASFGELSLLQKGDSFAFDGTDYEVLWPAEERYPFSPLFREAVEALHVCVSSPFLPAAAARFRELKEQLGDRWLACAKEPSPERAAAYGETLQTLFAMKEELRSMPFAPDLREILNRPVNRQAFRQELDGAGLVIQNRRQAEASLDDILLLGDATPETLDAVSPDLYESYFIVKAPAGGHPDFWSHVLGEISCQHMLISTGGTRFPLAAEYAELPCIRHCTRPEGCRWYQSSGCCCNRMCVCYDQEGEAGLTIRCPFVKGTAGSSCGSRIVVVSEEGERSCLCDRLPAVIH